MLSLPGSPSGAIFSANPGWYLTKAFPNGRSWRDHIDQTFHTCVYTQYLQILQPGECSTTNECPQIRGYTACIDGRCRKACTQSGNTYDPSSCEEPSTLICDAGYCAISNTPISSATTPFLETFAAPIWAVSGSIKVILWQFNCKIHFLVVWTLPLGLP